MAEIWGDFYEDNEGVLDPYFRHYFHAFKLIARSDLPREQGVQYASIARASLNRDELLLLLLNGLAERGRGLKTYVEEFGLLKHLGTSSVDGAEATTEEQIAAAFYSPTATLDEDSRQAHWARRRREVADKPGV